MVFSQQVNLVFEFQKTCFFSCLLEIAFRKKKSCLPLFPSVSVPSECAVSGVCTFNANELLPIDQ